MSNRKNLYDFVTKRLLGKTDFYQFLHNKYWSLATCYDGYVAIPVERFTVSIYCNDYASLKPDVDFEPGCSVEFEITGEQGMFGVVDHTPPHSDFHEENLNCELSQLREEVAEKLMSVLINDYAEFVSA